MTGKCPSCEVIDRVSAKPGVLYLVPPVPHTRQSIVGAVEAVGLARPDEETGMLAVRLDQGQLASLLQRLGDHLSGPELKDCRALFLEQGRSLNPGLVLSEALPLESLVGRVEMHWLVDLLERDSLTSHFHPIVETARPERTVAHEALLRGVGADGEVLSPGKLFAAGERADLMFHLDRAARLTAIREAQRADLDGDLFINFNPTAIYDPEFCLRTTVQAVQDAGMDPRRLVFEVIESERVGDSRHLSDILRYYRDAGFRVALDDLGAGYASLNLLGELRPDVVKFDRQLISGVDQDEYKQTILGKLVELARDLGIRMVGEGVETVAEWQYLRDCGVDYTQGFLFCRPDNPPPRVHLPTGVAGGDGA